MQTNKIDKQIANKLKNRELKPSVSAWERLSNQLDEQQASKKSIWYKYAGYAASILLLISLGFSFFSESTVENRKEIISNVTIDTLQLNDDKVDVKEIINVENALATKEEKEVEDKVTEKKIEDKVINYQQKKSYSIASVNKSLNRVEEIKKEDVPNQVMIAIADKKVIKETSVIKKEGIKSRVKVNGDDLLFAVTHSPQEVQEYYAKYKINRKEVLNTIQEELIKSNLKIDPETILAEVELDIEETDFQQNFMNKLKVKLSDVIVAFADRNK
ncbi:hypothetical protein H3Z83_00450 [Tenacibaculum sp. S7007]|uniref:Uncharacterized protein n=1 Tax=Tenacibaculum pelagium TaxID=2759527 RepID=A0A839ALA8_9FLAO|nr:hypothetical protein [Tenacibaculum pelagium]MBA6154994.1 hypothetical protein [Tenacibaculum pelagium]